MRTLVLALALCSTWALTAAHSEDRCEKTTFEDGFKFCWAERTGPQFLFAWSEDDIATVRRALDNLEQLHKRYPQGVDDYWMGRRARVLKKLEHPGFFRYGMYWDIDLMDGSKRYRRGPWGVRFAVYRRWRLQPMSLPETILSGFSVSRDQYCFVPETDENIDDWHYLDAAAICELHNNAAIELFERSFRNAHHETPGGAVR